MLDWLEDQEILISHQPVTAPCKPYRRNSCTEQSKLSEFISLAGPWVPDTGEQLQWLWLDLEKVKVEVTQSCLTLCDPVDYSGHGILQAWILEWVAFPFSRGSSQPRDRTQVSHTTGRLSVEPQWKPKNTGVGSLSLLQWIFPTQELNWSLLHCRWILYQLSYQGPWEGYLYS